MQNETAPTPVETAKKPKKPVKPFDVCNRTVWGNKKINHLYNILRILAVPFVWLALPYRYYGKKKIQPGAGVYIGNHYRMTDVVYPATISWEGVHYLAKREIFSHPVFKHFCKGLRVIAVSRDGTDVRAMMDALKCLKNGEKISLYPEGTRNKTDADFLPFKGGAAMMAIKAKAPIIPILIYKRPKFFRMTHIVIGDPVEFTEFYGKKLTEEDIALADQKLLEILRSLREEHTQFLAEKKAKRKSKK